jgi:hypothetical protein
MSSADALTHARRISSGGARLRFHDLRHMVITELPDGRGR